MAIWVLIGLQNICEIFDSDNRFGHFNLTMTSCTILVHIPKYEEKPYQGQSSPCRSNIRIPDLGGY